MDKQIKYLLGVLVLLLISAYFLSLLVGLPQYFEEDIIAFLEERFSGDISFSSVSLWPLNRIRLNNFEFTAEDGTSFKTESLNLDYSLNFNEEEIVRVDFIELLGAEIEVQGDFINLNQSLSAADNNGESDFSNADLLSALSLPDFFADLNVNIRNSNLILNTAALQLELSDLQLGLETDSTDNYRLNLSAGVRLRQLQLENDLELNNLNLSNLDLKFNKDNADADLYFAGEEFDLASAAANLPLNEFNYQDFEVDLQTLAGLASVSGEVIFSNNRISSYQSQLSIDDFGLQSSYNYAEGENENIALSAPVLNIQAAGPELSLVLNQNRIFIDQEAVDLSLEIDQSLNYQLKAAAADFNFDYQFAAPYLNEGLFDFDFNLSGAGNQLEIAAAEISASDLSSEYTALNSAEISFLLDQEELFLNRAQFSLAAGNQLSLTGSYNFEKENYLLSAEAENFRLSETLITNLNQIELLSENDYLSHLSKIRDERLDFRVDAAGLYGPEQGLSANGDLNLSFKTAAAGADFEIDSSFWYTDNKLLLNSFKAVSDYGRLDLMGELDLDSKEVKLRYAAHNLEPEIANEFLAQEAPILTELNPNIDYLEGSILNSFTNPTVNIRLEMKQLEYDSYLLEDLIFSAVYENDNLNINDLQAEIAQASVAASGQINNLSRLEEAELKLTFNSQDLYFEDLAAFSGQPLPLSGEVQLQAALSGQIADYNLDLSLDAPNSILEFDGQEIEFSNLMAEISRANGDFIINNLTAKQQNVQLNAAGRFNFTQGFDIDLELDNFEPASYLNNYQYAANNLNGSLSLTGNLSGDLENTVFDFELGSQDLSFAELGIEIADNSFSYNLIENTISIEQFNFAVDSGSYNLNGRVFDLNNEVKTELKLELLEVSTRELSLKFADFYPLAEDLIFAGAVDLNSQGLDYQAQVDLRAESEANQGNLTLTGTVDENLALDFEASELRLDFSSRQYDFNFNLSSLLDFSGSIEGGLEAPIVRLTHQLRELSVNGNSVELVEGEILLESDRRFSASESINYSGGGELTVDGSYSMVDDQLNLSSNLEALPLDFLISFLGEGYSASGSIDGAFRAEGSLQSPQLGGELELAAENLELGLTHPIEDLRGSINLNQGSAEVENLSGLFAEGNFAASGSMDFFDLENFWNLSLNGQQLYFEQGSLAGNFDAELAFVGPLLNPVLEGDLVTHDFVIGIPFEWPQNEADPDAFIPEINLDIRPGENVRVENENMEIIVETGTLNLQFDHTLDDPLRMQGRLRSQEGEFAYYNSRFNLENAEAIFTPVNENDIPDLSVNAVTYAGGNEITINLTGPADDMRITLSSNTDLTEEEILNLLSTQGALGSAIIGGEEIGVQNIIWQELMRVVNSFLQRGVLSDLESDFETIFSLDRAEINAFQYGTEREFTIYLGKNITDRLYLEYANYFNQEGREEEISFQYNLTEPTVLKGTYFGDQEYQISIETEIEF
ncbi:translocation and assembly module TamB [Halanaerobium saccharolyticum]|uniref:Translocation and assembly module TamB n=1 Tax=Halanaerobium saccharolyticum TaxID=43595 RepID=A0A4R7Z778_9FIRM|nr:translocation/assembly module TamB domain-containing protein [Halanaerobium saccharolyticum]RAK09805.1 translocation and assembly module TamB [Halanaerobium saccharolyticum]TDW07367.1 translocation and assembly module TamB [Halanaerobium saccharolyticum]TDX61246.1 translocation and assembly module TamB [Halanaerobium saccharolyticum]